MGKSRSNDVFKPPRTISDPNFLERGSDAAFRETIYALLQGAGRLSACRDAFGRALGLTGSQFAVLIGIAYRQGRAGVTVRDLSKHVALAPTHVTTEIGRLIDGGLVVKRPNESDRRSVLVSLSKAGEKAIVEVSPFVRAINDMLFVDISPRDLAVVSKVARKLVVNSERAMTELARHPAQKVKPRAG
jgi:DNA-binding MarR family transcriptional regulator